MAINIVWKGKSACVVEKGRNISERYICSLGTLTAAEMNEKRNLLKKIPQDKRERAVLENWNIVDRDTTDQYPDMPRRKAPTGDIREQPEKKQKKVRKTKKAHPTPKVLIIEDIRPLKQSVTDQVLSYSKYGMDVSQIKTRGAKITAIDTRINKINAQIKDQEIYLKHYKDRMGNLTTSEKQMRRDEAEKYKNYNTEGRKAIAILKRQKANVR
jgi:hypothetical protein